MRIIILIMLLTTGCGTEESKPSAVKSLPICCEGLASPPSDAVTMCKIVDEETRSVVDVKRSSTGMIQTLGSMQYERCE